MQALLPASVGRFKKRLLNDVAERPEKARREETGDNHQEKFVRERAAHARLGKQVVCRGCD